MKYIAFIDFTYRKHPLVWMQSNDETLLMLVAIQNIVDTQPALSLVSQISLEPIQKNIKKKIDENIPNSGCEVKLILPKDYASSFSEPLPQYEEGKLTLVIINSSILFVKNFAWKELPAEKINLKKPLLIKTQPINTNLNNPPIFIKNPQTIPRHVKIFQGPLTPIPISHSNIGPLNKVNMPEEQYNFGYIFKKLNLNATINVWRSGKEGSIFLVTSDQEKADLIKAEIYKAMVTRGIVDTLSYATTPQKSAYKIECRYDLLVELFGKPDESIYMKKPKTTATNSLQSFKNNGLPNALRAIKKVFNGINLLNFLQMLLDVNIPVEKINHYIELHCPDDNLKKELWTLIDNLRKFLKGDKTPVASISHELSSNDIIRETIEFFEKEKKALESLFLSESIEKDRSNEVTPYHDKKRIHEELLENATKRAKKSPFFEETSLEDNFSEQSDKSLIGSEEVFVESVLNFNL